MDERPVRAPVAYNKPPRRPMNRGMGRRLRIRRNEHGFTIVEVMVAMVVLLVGLAGTITLLDQANASTTTDKAREGGVALARELVEATRSQSYDQLTQGNIVPVIRTRNGFTGSAVNGNGWQISRRGITYTMAVGVCSVDDSNDGLGVRDSTFCASDGTTTSDQCATALGTSGSISGVGTAAGTVVGDCGIDLDKDGQVDGLTLGDVGPVLGHRLHRWWHHRHQPRRLQAHRHARALDDRQGQPLRPAVHDAARTRASPAPRA